MYVLRRYDSFNAATDKEFDSFVDLRHFVVDGLKDYLLNDLYNVYFEPEFNRVQVWDSEGQIIEYGWFEN